MDIDRLIHLLTQLLTLATVLVALNYFVQIYLDRYKQKKLEGRIKVRNKKDPIYKTMPLVGPLYRGFYNRLQTHKNEHLSEILTGVTVGVTLIPLVLFGYFGQYLLMIAIPVAILKAVTDILAELDVSQEALIVQQLPRTIDNIIKTAGRHGNIQIALSEATFGLQQPMKGELEKMVRRMNSQDRRSVLEQFQEDYKNPWIRSFIFILTSLVEDAERKTALDNLKTLREMMESEDKITMQSISDKRQSVIQNYIIAGLAFVASVIALFTEPGRNFYFESGIGLASLLGGYIAIFVTIRMNISMLSKKEGN